MLVANRLFYEAFSRRDLAAMVRVWATEHAVSCVHPGWHVLRGREAVLSSFRAILSSSDSPDLHASDEVVVLVGDTAVVTCHEHVRGAEVAATNVFVREREGWKMISHHASAAAVVRPQRTPPSTLN